MVNYAPNIAKLTRVILGAYDTLAPETDEDRETNEALIQQLKEWLASSDRVFPPAAQYSINRFVEAELDYDTDGNRGLGRMTDECPRFGGNYRATLRSLDADARVRLKIAFGDELAVGYLFGEYLVECFSNSPVPRAQFQNGSVGVFEQWVPTIYSAGGPPQFDSQFAQDNASYYEVKGLWGHSAGDIIHALFAENGIPVDEFAQHLIRQYFDAGVMLRVTEMREMSDDELADIVTGGGYSAGKAYEARRRASTEVVKDIFEFRNMPRTAGDIANAISAIGLTMADVQSNPGLVFEAGIAQNFRRACESLEIPISPHQSFILAKHLRVSADNYRSGIPLSDHERSIAIQLQTIHMQAYCEEQGKRFTEEHRLDCERGVRFGERGLHVGHKIGEATGCFQIFVLATFSTVSVIVVIIQILQGGS